MLKAPKVPWQYRLAALVLAVGLGLFCGEFYILGRKFAGAVTNYTKLIAAEEAEQAKPKPKPPEFSNEPGVVPVSIIPADKKKQ